MAEGELVGHTALSRLLFEAEIVFGALLVHPVYEVPSWTECVGVDDVAIRERCRRGGCSSEPDRHHQAATLIAQSKRLASIER